MSSGVAEALIRAETPLVVKVGGSLADTGRLEAKLAMIAAARVPLVVVPGGGPFADGIRALQPKMQFSEATAHRLAMLGMHQMAELMVSMQPQFVIVSTLDEIADAVVEGDVAVWVPLAMMTDDLVVPSDWTATSDSLSARLAELLGARLVLIKSVSVDGAPSAEDVARQGIVDMSFPGIVARAGLSWSIYGPRDDHRLAAVLAGDGDT